MSDEISVGGIGEWFQDPKRRRLVPMKVGNAVVYIEQVGEGVEVAADDTIYPVAPTPVEAFEQAGQALEECVRVLGERITTLGHMVRPEKVTVEFTLAFEASGTARIIPFFVSTSSKVNTGLKVTAEWDRSRDKTS